MRAWRRSLCLGWRRVEAHWRKGGHIIFVDAAELRFIFFEVFGERSEKALGVFGCKDDPGLHASFRHVGSHADEVKNEFRLIMRDDGEVAVFAVGNVVREFDLQLGRLNFFVGHGGKLIFEK